MPAQIGLVVLVGLGVKKAILVVEFTVVAVHDDEPEEAASTASKTPIRPILMASFAFILGFFPFAGSEMRQLLGTAVCFGMLGVTLGLPSTPRST